MKNNTTNITSEGASKKLVPELRFPEFKNEGEWEEYKLDDVAEFFKGKGISKQEVVSNGKVPCIRYGELYTTYNEVIDQVKSSTNIPINELFVSKANDIIIPSSGETKEDISTASCVLRDNIALGGDINVLRSKQNGIFLSYYLNNAKKNEIAKIAQGISIIHLYNEQLRALKVSIPTLAEQQKIAQCLSSLDELIAATKEKVELQKEHKRGLMQKLFPTKGKTFPELRFPEFNDDGEWKYVPMCRISRKITDKYKSDKTLPVLTNSASSGVVKQQDYFDREIVTKSNLDNYQILDVDDFVYNPRTSSIAPVGPISRNNLTKGIMSPLYTVFRFHDGDKEFLEHFFNSNSWHDYIKKKANFGARYDRINISTDEFFGLPIPLPSIAEQKKIASVLSFLDNMIEQYIEKVNVLELHKKGLMQKLFPQK